MSGDRGRDAEAAARRQLARLIDAIAVDDTPPAVPVDDVQRGPSLSLSRRRGPWLAAAAAAVLLAAGTLALTRNDEPPVSTVDEEQCVRETGTGTDAPQPPEPTTRTVVASGALPGGDPWELVVNGEAPVMSDPPGVVAEVTVDGEEVWRNAWDQTAWSASLADGSLTWGAHPLDDGSLLVFGQLPVEASRVEIAMPDGDPVVLCPAAASNTSGYQYAAGVLPPGSAGAAIEALDPGGRVVAQGSVGELGLLAQMQIVPDNVLLPLGGPTEVARGVLPEEPPFSGRRWSLVAQRPTWQSLLYQVEFDSLSGTSGMVGIQYGGGDDGQRLDDVGVWGLVSVDGGYVIWGLVPDDIPRVIVGLSDGNDLTYETVDASVPGLTASAFVAKVPEGLSFVDVTARDAADTIRFYALDVPAAIEGLDADPYGETGTLRVAEYDEGTTFTVPLPD